jgi:hypothetical protein
VPKWHHEKDNFAMSSLSRPPDAVEQLPVPLFEGVVLAARSPDGAVYLALRDLCITLKLNLAAQRRRIRDDDNLHLMALRIFDGRQFRALDFLLLDDVPTWILTIQLAAVNDEVRDRIRYIKEYLVGAVKAAFAQLTQLPDKPSRAIEDLRELDHIEQAFENLTALASRQESLEQSQDRARVVFRDLQAQLVQLQSRIQVLEQQAKIRISPAQRGTLYNMVQRWGQAAATRQKIDAGEGIRASWRLFNKRFELATYTDLPAAYYDDAIQFIKEQYRGLTNREIDAVEQGGLELDL